MSFSLPALEIIAPSDGKIFIEFTPGNQMQSHLENLNLVMIPHVSLVGEFM